MLSTQAWNAFLKTLRSRRRTRSSCWPRPRRTRSCPPWSTAATASTSRAQRSSSRGAAPRGRAEGIELPARARSRCSRVRRRARSATRWGTSSRWSRTRAPEVALAAGAGGARRGRRRGCCSGRRRRASGDARAALGAVGARSPTAAVTPGQFIRDLEEHRRALLVVGALGARFPMRSAITPEGDDRLAEQAGARRRAPRWCGCST